MKLLDDARRAIEALEKKGRLRGRRAFEGAMGHRLLLEGREVHNFSSNDYLGLAGDERLVHAANQSSGLGAGASRLIVSPAVHRELERSLARWLQREDVQLFNSGYAANVGMLSTIAGEGTVVFSDELNHASIIDGCRLSRAKVVVYRHADIEDLEEKLASVGECRKLVVSESLFSMDGDLADVGQLRALADRYGAALVLDEAHAVGVRGPQGRGVAAELGVVPDLLIGTLGKAFGCYGAFVAGDAVVMDWLWNRARSLVFSTGLPALLSEAALVALEIICSDEGARRRDQVEANWRSVATRLGVPAQSQIVPWLVGADSDAVALSNRLLEAGVFVQAIRPPTVPEGTARLRIALGTHATDAMDALVGALGTISPG